MNACEVIKTRYDGFFEALLEGNAAAAQTHVQHLLQEQVSPVDLYEHLFRRALYDVGDLWESHRITVADEHLATALVDRLLLGVYPRMCSTERKGFSVVVACVVNEFHYLGGRMVADIFELHGWDGYFLGASTPVDALLDLVRNKAPDVVALSVAVTTTFDKLQETLEALRALAPSRPILVGGQAFQRDSGLVGLLESQAVYLSSLADLERYIEEFPTLAR